MSKKYLSLDEAAQILGMATDELVRLREKGDVRGFADRGTWKFKSEDIESLQRRRQVDSNPEVPLLDPDFSFNTDSDVGEQPTVIRGDRASESDINLFADDTSLPLKGSDSDVRLVGGKNADFDFDADSDSDVKLFGFNDRLPDNVGTDPEIEIKKPGSDSDVRLVRADSDSDIKLVTDNSDSDVKIVGSSTDADLNVQKSKPSTGTDFDLTATLDQLGKSDSDVRLVPDSDKSDFGDVTLLPDDDAVAIDFTTDSSDQGSVLDEDSGITLSRDSALLMGESGISLAGPNDSGIALNIDDDDEGITLALDDESGISLDSGDSGISLFSDESGISLVSDDRGGTVPMMDALSDHDDNAATQYDVSSIDDDSGYDVLTANETGAMDIQEDDGLFDLDDEGSFEEANDFDEDADFEEASFDDENDHDVFDADEAFGDDAGAGYAVPAASRIRAADAEWDTITFVGLTIGSLLLVACGLVMIDLVKNTATAASPNPVSGQIMELLGSLYK
ncbi:hypothetical protein SH668x_002560 [Planctomicrobium sp. SH668]|uniref:helix-turn-helix domain-containing protein n=1 Tax=Planctomicrobium sp. SH668 TaxID=3448126 RepID=UPI003F5C6211